MAAIVAFQSNASNLVAGDGNNRSDIFVHDRNRHVTERVSVASDGTEGTNNAIQPSISSDGRLVAFASLDSTLIPGDTNNVFDIFIHDRLTDTTRRVSERPGSRFGAGDDSFAPAISGDGCFVAFETDGAGTLVPDDTNGEADVYVVDLGCGGAGTSTPGGSDPIGPQPPTTDPVGEPGRDPIASPVRGTVRVRTPGQRRFVRLRRAGAIPDGSEIDTRRGVLRLTVGRASALVSQGRATINRVTLKLTGRKLLVRVTSGRFRTRAKRTTTTGRRATWLTTQRGKGSVTKVVRGKVALKDLARRRTVRLQAGDRYRVRSSQARTAPQ